VIVEAEALVEAPPAIVYHFIADYREGHPRIVPPEYFRDLTVTQGGVGAGTEIRFTMTVFGIARELRASIAEPVPGKILTETDLDTGTRSTFTVTERDGGRAAHVSIRTELVTRGLRGWIEGLVARPMLRKIYAMELKRLAAVAAGEVAP
jgi:hypothetical protein